MDTRFETFEKDVIAASRELPVVVDFWAPWCGPCRVLGPVLEKLEQEAQGRWRLVKVNTEAEPMLAQQFRISSIPAVKLFKDGAVAAEFMGALPESQVLRWLDQHVPRAAAKLVTQAEQAVQAGDPARAKELLAQALASDPELSEAQVRLAELIFADEPERAVELVAGIDRGHALFVRADSLRTLARLRQVAADPAAQEDLNTQAPAWPTYEQGIQAFLAGRYGEALSAWIDVIRRDRKLDQDGARRACVALFHWLGEEHPLTREYRRPFSSALF